MNISLHKHRGFTLLEIIVSVGVFSIVMLVAVGALLSVIDANRKARALQAVIQNLDFALDSMSRQIRTGSTYHCGTGDYSVPADCNPKTVFAFEARGGNSSTVSDQVVYQINNNQIERSTQGGISGSFFPITAPDIVVERLFFVVFGSGSGDSMQPRVLISIDGTAGVGKIATPFHVQTNITQRVVDS